MADVADPPRYRVEEGVPVVDLRLPGIEHLFDNRDPAPFRARDLDPNLVEYLLDAAEDQPAKAPFRIVFWLARGCPPEEVVEAVRSHFTYELERLQRGRRRQHRIGAVALIIAIIAIVALTALAELVTRVVPGTLGAAMKEALVISGWVLMWKPIEVLVYDGIPWRQQRRAVRAILEAAIEVREGAGP